MVSEAARVSDEHFKILDTRVRETVTEKCFGQKKQANQEKAEKLSQNTSKLPTAQFSFTIVSNWKQQVSTHTAVNSKLALTIETSFLASFCTILA